MFFFLKNLRKSFLKLNLQYELSQKNYTPPPKTKRRLKIGVSASGRYKLKKYYYLKKKEEIKF